MKIRAELLVKTILTTCLLISMLSEGYGQIATETRNGNDAGSISNTSGFKVAMYDDGQVAEQADPITLLLPRGHDRQITSLNVRGNGELISTSDGGLIHYWHLGEMSWLRSRPNDEYSYFEKVNDGGFAYAIPMDPNVFGRSIENACSLDKRPAFTGDALTEYTDVHGFGKGFSVDGLYRVSGNLLVPYSKSYGEAIPLEYYPHGFSDAGTEIYRLDGDTLTTWSYPVTTYLSSIDILPGAKGYDISIQKGARFVIGKWAAEDSEYQRFRVWDRWKDEMIADLELPAYTQVTEVAPDGRYLLLYSDEYRPREHPCRRRYVLATKTIDLSFDPPQAYSDRYNRMGPSVFSKDGKIVCSPSMTGAIHLFSAETGELLYKLEPKIQQVTHLALNKEETVLVLGFMEWNQDWGLRKTWQWNYSNYLKSDSLSRAKYDHFFLNDVSAGFSRKEYAYVPINQIMAGGAKPVTNNPSENTDGPIPDTTFLSVRGAHRDWETICRFEILESVAGVGVTLTKVSYRDTTWRLGEDQRFANCAIFADSLIAVGTRSGGIIVFSSRGKQLYSLAGHENYVRSLAFFAGGKKIVSSSSDGSVRIWDLKRQKELARLYLLNDKDWVVLNEDLLFDASPGAMSELKFLVDYGGGFYGQKSEIIELGQMKGRFYEPGLLQKLLGYSDQPIRSVEGLADIPLYPEVDLSLDRPFLNVRLEPRKGGMGRVSLSINGKELKEDIRGMWDEKRDSSYSLMPVPMMRSASMGGQLIRVDLDRPEFQKFFLQENVLTIRAYNDAGSLYSRDHTIQYERKDRPQLVARGAESGNDRAAMKAMARTASLFVVCVGTSRYGKRSMRLTYPDLDAQVMSRSLRSVGNELFSTQGKVEVHCLTTNNKDSKEVAALKGEGINWKYADKKSIQDVFTEIAEKAKAQDVVVVYLSGHGKTIKIDGKDMFHYLTHEAISLGENDQTILRNVAISSAELTSWTTRIAAYKQVFMVDACNAGQLLSDLNGSRSLNSSQIRALERMSDRAGNYLISGSAANKVSYEASNYGQGLLTYALLKGMKAEALTETDGTDHYVGVTELFEYAKEEVGKLAEKNGGVQEPQVSYPLEAGTFALGIHNDNVYIPLGAVKPIVIRARLQSEVFYSDTLGLETKLNQRCQLETDKGKDATFIFLDIDRLTNAYQLRARYQMNKSGKISVKGILYKAGAPDIPINVRSQEKDELIEALFKAIRQPFISPPN